jgi:predicted nucleic acid-binding protein
LKYFFDTSILVAAFQEDHEHHEPSFAAFLKADRSRACCAAHSLAEVYATLTRMPGKNRVSGEQAMLFLQDVRERLSVVTLTADEYFAALTDAASAGIVGGAVYDALLARCALKSGATTIYTWNIRHFQRLGPEIARRVKVPGSNS